MRKNYREVPLSKFVKIETMSDLIERLFGVDVNPHKDVEHQTLSTDGAKSLRA